MKNVLSAFEVEKWRSAKSTPCSMSQLSRPLYHLYGYNGRLKAQHFIWWLSDTANSYRVSVGRWERKGKIVEKERRMKSEENNSVSKRLECSIVAVRYVWCGEWRHCHSFLFQELLRKSFRIGRLPGIIIIKICTCMYIVRIHEMRNLHPKMWSWFIYVKMVNKHKSWTSTVLPKQPNNINRIKKCAWQSHPGNNFDFQKIKIIKAYLLNGKRKWREGEGGGETKKKFMMMMKT